MPDKDKVMVLKYYKAITDVNNDLLNDVSLYRKSGDCKGLGCSEKPANPAFQDEKFSGRHKYKNLLMEFLNIDEEGASQDGGELRFSSQSLSNSKYTAEILLSLNNGNSYCFYSSSCPKPREFKFHVDTYGNVTGADPLTKAYLENPNKLNDKKADYARAKELLAN